MMGENEEGTLERLKAVRAELVDPTIAQHRGRIFKTMGDGLLVEFASVVDAVKCAISIQHRMSERTVRSMVEERIEFRIGVNVGDVIIDGEDIYGDGVNIAARLEPLAEPGGICVSGRVYDDAPGRIDAEFEDLGEQRLKNINRAVRVYKVRARVEAAAPGQSPSGFGVPVPGDQGVRSELFDWLSSHELSKYYPVFVAHDVDLPTLHELTEKDLETLEIPMGARRRLLASFVGRQTLSAESGSPLASSTQILRKIGYLGVGPRPDHDEFRRSLGVYGYIDGKTLGVEYRWCDGVYQRYPALLKELIEQRVELIVADATPAVAAAKEATSTTPIVMVGVGDPIGYGIVPSLMRPGGNCREVFDW